jgi:hypothetical protein
MFVIYLGLKLYKAQYGEYPNTLANIHTLDVPVLTLDCFTGAQEADFGYHKKSDGSFLLYSVGPDTQNDDGVAIDATIAHPGSPRHTVSLGDKGDMVAWVNTY